MRGGGGGGTCVSAYVRACVRAHRVVPRDIILSRINTLIIYCYYNPVLQ